MDKPMEDAIRFISTELNANPSANRSTLIQEAAQKFNLDPKQTEFLIKKYVMS